MRHLITHYNNLIDEGDHTQATHVKKALKQQMYSKYEARTDLSVLASYKGVDEKVLIVLDLDNIKAGTFEIEEVDYLEKIGLFYRDEADELFEQNIPEQRIIIEMLNAWGIIELAHWQVEFDKLNGL